MPQNLKILASKLLLPGSSDTIIRDRLSPIFDKITQKRVTIVTAGAGYGKTTLISQACSSLGVKTIWYRIDNHDKDFVTFLNYLISGFRKYYPGFGENILNNILSVQVLSQELNHILTLLLSEVETTVEHELIIVFDDYHLIQESREIDESLKFFMDRLPSYVHLIIISRTDTGLLLSRLRAMRDVFDITESDLSFTAPEIETLYLKLFNISVTNKSLKHIHKTSSGWVSGLILFSHLFKGKTPEKIDSLLTKLQGAPDLIGKYLEENVFDQLPGEIKNFLIKTSILTRLDVELCNRLLKIENARDILKYLEKNHLFTFPFDEFKKSYHYHHLFNDFLKTRFEIEITQKRRLQLHKKAAIAYEENEDIEEAVRHYLSARQIENACRLLSDIGRQLLWKGRLNLINSYLAVIPVRFINKEPWIQYMLAQSLDICGQIQNAIPVYKKALNNFKMQQTEHGEVLCLRELGRSYFITGDLQKAVVCFKQVLKHNDIEAWHRIEALGELIFTTAYLGKISESDQYYKKALSILPEDETYRDISRAFLNLCQGFRFHYSGDLKETIAIVQEVKVIFQDTDLSKPLGLCYQILSSTYYLLGRFQEGFDNAQKGMEIAISSGFGVSRAWCLLMSGLNYFGLGRTQDAIKYANQSMNAFKQVGSRQGQSIACILMAKIFFKAGDFQALYEKTKIGLRLVEDLNLSIIKGELEGMMALFHIQKRQFDHARTCLENAEKNFAPFRWHRFWLLLVCARFHWEQGHQETGIKKLMAGLEICRSNSYDQWLTVEKEWSVPFLMEIFNQGKMRSYIIELLYIIAPETTEKLIIDRETGETPAKSPSSSDLIHKAAYSPTPALKVCLFGEFKLHIGQRHIVSSDWRNKKALMLLKYFLHFRSRGYIKKDILMEMLWPDEDPGKTENRFWVAVNSLKKTLEPELKKRAQSSYIKRNKDAYKIVIGEKGLIDTEVFIQKIETAKENKEQDTAVYHYLEAESVYKGDFLEEDQYLQWCDEERERYRTLYLEALSGIMIHFKRHKNFGKCIDYAEKYLKVDKYNEIVYCNLMENYSATGNKSMVLKTFDLCKYHIQKGLDCPVSKETEILYNTLMDV